MLISGSQVGDNMTLIDDSIKLIQACTDELLAVTVVGGTMIGYFVGVEIPTEAMYMVLGFYFLKKGIEAARST